MITLYPLVVFYLANELNFRVSLQYTWLALKCLISSLFNFCFTSWVLIHCTKHTHEHLWCLFRCVFFFYFKFANVWNCRLCQCIFFFFPLLILQFFSNWKTGEANSTVVVLQFMGKECFTLQPRICYLLLGKGTVEFEMIVIEQLSASLWHLIFMNFLFYFVLVLCFGSLQRIKVGAIKTPNNKLLCWALSKNPEKQNIVKCFS